MTFALLDDRDATRERPTSRLYTGFVREHRCTDPASLDAVWAQVQADQQAGLHAVMLADYEWGAKLQGAGIATLPADDASALRVLMFDTLDLLSRDDVDAWLQPSGPTEPEVAGVSGLHESVTPDEFRNAIERIHDAIRAGETYQVNYTYRLDGIAYGSPLALYRRLRGRQPVPYGAFIALPEGEHILSCSPELFLRRSGDTLTAKPMKGTARRVRVAEGDSEMARWLADDVKNRAENLMIVDLLRNDLGRIARTGSVRVPELFHIESHATVLQMTSTVQAQALPALTFPDLLRASFPCGSITGAPKHHTMELIEQFESTPRGLYTGSLGWVDANDDFCLSVTIRTLRLGPSDDAGRRALRLGIGAGIVLDSEAESELDECRLKARFLTGLDPGFTLFETMRARRETGIERLDAHLARLSASARALGFAFDATPARAMLERHVQTLAPQADGACFRVRLDLSHDGRLQVGGAVLAPVAEPVTLIEAATAQARPQLLAGHKTSVRNAYDAGIRAAEAAGAFDSLFFTLDGHLIEGGRSNVFVKLGGAWFTPPLADGALPGVMRAELLASLPATERRIERSELLAAEAIVVSNALRGALAARLDFKDFKGVRTMAQWRKKTPDETYSPDEIAARLADECPKWTYEDGWIRRKYKTSGWKGTLMVVNTVGHLAEAAWHHPDLTVSYAFVNVKLMNHVAKGITDKDFELAKQIEAVVMWRPAAVEGSALEGTPDDPRFKYVKYD